MKYSRLLLLSIFSLIVISCGSGGGGARRALVDHDPCKEDNKELVGLDSDQRQYFYNVLAPVANIDRALDLAPKKDKQKAKIPEAQGKIIKDIREMCLVQMTELGPDYSYQSFKGQKSTSGKSENVICPVQLKQEVIPDKTLPAFADTITKEVKSHLDLSWKKSTPDYKELGLIEAVEMKGEAKTEWVKNSANQVNVSEKFALKVDITNKDPLVGEYKVCRKYYSAHNAKYELAVTRIELTVDKVVMQGKYLTFTKYTFDQSTQEWELTGRDPRNDFYLNNILLNAAEITELEKKRKEAAGL